MKEDEKKWEVLDSEYLFRRPWLTARRDHVRLPNGNENKEYYVLEYSDWVNVIARTADGKYIIERQYRHGLGQTCYEIVAGTVDPTDSSHLDAAKRELWEEAGYAGGTWRLNAVLSANPSAMNNLAYCFVAEGVEKVSGQHLEPTEDIDILLLTEDEVRRLLENDEIRQSVMAASLWKYLSRKKHFSYLLNFCK